MIDKKAEVIALEVQALSAEIYPLLAGKGPEVQGAVLADLVSMLLAGCWPQDAREPLLAEFVALVRALVPVSEVQIFGAGGYPAGRQRQ